MVDLVSEKKAFRKDAFFLYYQPKLERPIFLTISVRL